MMQILNFHLMGNFQHLEATPDIISRLLTEMLSKGLNVLPGTFQQVNPGLGMKKFERMQFTDQKNNLSIMLNVDSIHISTNIIKGKFYNLEKNITEFISNVNKVISSIVALEEDISGSRISLIVSVLHDEQKIKPLNEIYEIFGNSIPSYNSDETFEWGMRAVRRESIDILEKKEEINIVSEVMRTQGEFENLGITSNFETINTVVDINTVYENKNERISSTFAKAFFESITKKMVKQHNDIEVKLK